MLLVFDSRRKRSKSLRSRCQKNTRS